MTYVLDGIKTAMTAKSPIEGIREGSMLFCNDVRCPCGWECNEAQGVSLRFHYTHCPKAKAPEDAAPEGTE